ncbi:MAG TPA: PilZ domain-containing protein [Terriglobales bacterium]|nr:PilZ domain-containing protein [Terriglobales bacterium]
MYVDNGKALARSRDYNVRRQEPRYVSSVPVGLQRFLRFGPFVTRGVTLDISLRGMSALVCGAPRAGETVVIVLSLQDAPIEMLATVRHSSDAKSGFEFYPLSSIAQQGIRAWIQELKKHEETLFPYPYLGAAKVGSD